MQADSWVFCGNSLHKQVDFSQCFLVILYEMSDVLLTPEASLILGMSVLQQLLVLRFNLHLFNKTFWQL